jgi:hypothetical protein
MKSAVKEKQMEDRESIFPLFEEVSGAPERALPITGLVILAWPFHRV